MSSAKGPLRGLGPASKALLVAGLTDTPLPVPGPDVFRDEATVIADEGLAPVALALAGQGEGLHPETFELLHGLTFQTQIRCMAAGLAARGVLRRIDELGIAAVVIKGPSVERFHPAGWPRAYSDIDLLVAPRDFYSVVNECHRAGFEDAVSRPPWPWFDLRCKEGVNIHGEDGGNLDIHHHVPPWAFGVDLDVDAAVAGSTWGDVAGVPVRLVGAPHCLVIASLHVLNDLWKGSLGLKSWRDILALLRHIGIDQAETTFVEMELGWLLDLVTNALAVHLPEAEVPVTRRHYRTPPVSRARLAALGWSSDSALSRLRATYVARLPIPEAAAFLAGCAVPQRSWVRERNGSYVKYWGSLFTEARSTIGGEDHRMKSLEGK